MLLPALAKAKEAGRTTVCANNLRQITLGAIQYSEDYEGKIPAAATLGGADS
jgi:hypothetical protein